LARGADVAEALARAKQAAQAVTPVATN